MTTREGAGGHETPGEVGRDVDLGDHEAICRLKYAYFRLLDLKRFDELGELLTEDATASYDTDGGTLSGRAAIVRFLDRSLGDPGILTMHQGHHPELTLRAPGEAEGVWYLQDRVIVPAFDVEINGTAFYHDRYTKRDGRWQIAHTGYERVFEERRKRSTLEVTSFRHRFEERPGT